MFLLLLKRKLILDKSGFHDKKDKGKYFVFIKIKDTDTRMN